MLSLRLLVLNLFLIGLGLGQLIPDSDYGKLMQGIQEKKDSGFFASNMGAGGMGALGAGAGGLAGFAGLGAGAAGLGGLGAGAAGLGGLGGLGAAGLGSDGDSSAFAAPGLQGLQDDSIASMNKKLAALQADMANISTQETRIVKENPGESFGPKAAATIKVNGQMPAAQAQVAQAHAASEVNLQTAATAEDKDGDSLSTEDIADFMNELKHTTPAKKAELVRALPPSVIEAVRTIASTASTEDDEDEEEGEDDKEGGSEEDEESESPSAGTNTLEGDELLASIYPSSTSSSSSLFSSEEDSSDVLASFDPLAGVDTIAVAPTMPVHSSVKVVRDPSWSRADVVSSVTKEVAAHVDAEAAAADAASASSNNEDADLDEELHRQFNQQQGQQQQRLQQAQQAPRGSSPSSPSSPETADAMAAREEDEDSNEEDEDEEEEDDDLNLGEVDKFVKLLLAAPHAEKVRMLVRLRKDYPQYYLLVHRLLNIPIGGTKNLPASHPELATEGNSALAIDSDEEEEADEVEQQLGHSGAGEAGEAEEAESEANGGAAASAAASAATRSEAGEPEEPEEGSEVLLARPALQIKPLDPRKFRNTTPDKIAAYVNARLAAALDPKQSLDDQLAVRQLILDEAGYELERARKEAADAAQAMREGPRYAVEPTPRRFRPFTHKLDYSLRKDKYIPEPERRVPSFARDTWSNPDFPGNAQQRSRPPRDIGRGFDGTDGATTAPFDLEGHWRVHTGLPSLGYSGRDLSSLNVRPPRFSSERTVAPRTSLRVWRKATGLPNYAKKRVRRDPVNYRSTTEPQDLNPAVMAGSLAEAGMTWREKTLLGGERSRFAPDANEDDKPRDRFSNRGYGTKWDVDPTYTGPVDRPHHENN